MPERPDLLGLAIMALIYAVGHLSGAHINPAVTPAFTLTRHFPRGEAVAYMAAQLAGAAARCCSTSSSAAGSRAPR